MKKLLQYSAEIFKSPILVVILAALIFLLFSGIYNARMKFLDKKISKYETESAIHKAQMDSMKKENALLMKGISEREEKIKNHLAIDSVLDAQISVLNNVIYNIQSKYEKAFYYANHYGSDSIRWYFSNLK